MRRWKKKWIDLEKWVWTIGDLVKTRLWSILGPDPNIGQCCPPLPWDEVIDGHSWPCSANHVIAVASDCLWQTPMSPPMSASVGRNHVLARFNYLFICCFLKSTAIRLCLSPASFAVCPSSTLHIPFAGCYLEQWFHLLQLTVCRIYLGEEEAGGGKRGRRRKIREEGEKKPNGIACCHLIWHQRLFVAVIISGIQGRRDGGWWSGSSGRRGNIVMLLWAPLPETSLGMAASHQQHNETHLNKPLLLFHFIVFHLILNSPSTLIWTPTNALCIHK